jgi:K+-sensing histidine kinase KdpD
VWGRGRAIPEANSVIVIDPFLAMAVVAGSFGLGLAVATALLERRPK